MDMDMGTGMGTGHGDVVRVGIVQLCSTDDLNANLAAAEQGIREASERGATFVALPENFAYMRREGDPFPCAQESDGEIIRHLCVCCVWEYEGVLMRGLGDYGDFVPFCVCVCLRRMRAR
jgi:hypothetical protein